MMPDEQRKAIVIQCEGNCLGNVNHATVEHASDVARAVIDGWMNGLVRMEGEEMAAKYAFALADRVVNRAIKVTPMPAVDLSFTGAAHAAKSRYTDERPVPPPTSRAMGWRRLAREALLPGGSRWVAGFICGLGAAWHRP